MGKITKKQATKMFVELSWFILECKCLYYYYPETGSPLSDAEFDKHEGRYKKLAKLLKLEPSACNKVDFPVDLPSSKIILERAESGKNFPMIKKILKKDVRIKKA